MRFGDQQILHLRGHGGAIAVGRDARLPRAHGAAQRRLGSGRDPRLAGQAATRLDTSASGRAADERRRWTQFRRQQIDLYVPAGDTGYWLGALRDPAEPIYDIVRRAATRTRRIQVDLLYGDHEGGQRTIVRFVHAPWPGGRARADGRSSEDGKRVTALRYWNVDRDDPR